MTNKRLLKEYVNITKEPINNIIAKPREDNILIWNYIIVAEKDPYNGGLYHGILEFHKDYPMKPPSIKMFTPNGRFETDVRICLSMSDYHPETWNPSWGVRTILIGLYSFMLDDDFGEGTIGSIKETSAKRRFYAENSLEFNNKNSDFVELFKEYEISKSNKINKCEEMSTCRYCFEGNDELIAPCKCIGSNKWVHKKCLAKWQYTCILSQSTHPKYQTGIESTCNVCSSKFEIIEFNRKDLMLEFTGNEISNMLDEGFYIVSSKKSSEYNKEIIEKHKTDKELVDNISHWTYSVFLITQVIKSPEGDSIHGVSLTNIVPRLSDKPNIYFKWTTYKKYLNLNLFNITHYIGGPCCPDIAYCLVTIDKNNKNLIKFRKEDANLVKTITYDNYIILFAKLDVIIYLQGHYPYMFKRGIGDNINLRVIWGLAGWSRTQLLGEIAKGSWGMCRGDINELFPIQKQLWESLNKSSRPIYSGANDFSQKYT